MSAGASIIDELFIRLGVVPDVAGLDAFKRKAEEATGTLLKYGSAVGAVLGAVAVKAVAMVGDEFEQNQIALAGFMSSLGISSDFNQGLKDADATLQSITKAAALLPGEASEYIEVFRAGLVGIKGAMPNGTLDEMTKFSNTFAAVGKTLQVDAPQIGRDLSLMLGVTGRAGGHVLTFQRMLPFLMQLEGHAKITAQEFNAMSQPKRLELLQQAFVKLQPMLDRSASSFDAMKGAAVSAGKQMLRLGTVRVFEGMKVALAKLGAMFFDAKGNITKTGEKVVRFGEQVSGMVVQAVTSFAALVKWLAESDGTMAALKVTVALLGIALAGLAIEKVAGSVGMLIYSLTNLKRLFTGMIAGAIFLVAEDLYTFYTGGESVTGMIVAKLGPAGLWLSKVVLGGLVVALAAVRFAFVRTAIKAAASWALMFWPLTLLVTGIAGLILTIQYLRKHWDEFSAGAKTAIAVVATALGVLGSVLIALKASALVASAQMAVGFALMASPVYIVIAALVATGVTLFLLWKNWERIVNFMRDHWVSFVALVYNVPVFGPLLAAIVAVGTHFDETIAKMKAAWNSFAELVNKAGVITLPKFSEKPAELPAGDGVRMPGQTAEGPSQWGWTSPYARGSLPAGGMPEGPAYSPTGLTEGKKTGLLDDLTNVLGAKGLDVGSMLGGVGGLQAAGFGGSANAPPQALLDQLAAYKGGNVTNTEQFNVGDVTVKLDGTATPEQAEKFAEAIKDAMRREARDKTSRTIRNTRSGEEH